LKAASFQVIARLHPTKNTKVVFPVRSFRVFLLWLRAIFSKTVGSISKVSGSKDAPHFQDAGEAVGKRPKFH
jgi:hypothetical protein